jgi:hypothetical protein
MKISGSCLCKKITFRIEQAISRFAICYCSRCRKATGSAHASNLFIKPDKIEWISGVDNIKRFELPEAQRFAKAFCDTCGVPVPCLSRDAKRYLIPAGCLDDDPGISPDIRIYNKDKANWYRGLDAIPVFDGPPK